MVVCVCVCVSVCVCVICVYARVGSMYSVRVHMPEHGMCLEVRGQLMGVASLLPSGEGWVEDAFN